MLYLGIDQHRKQLTVNLRNETGDVLLKRQVSTVWERVHEFFAELGETSRAEGGFVAVLEVCGFNDWLLKLLQEYGCRETILIQPEKQSKKKTDRRDANALGEILWVNRHRLLAGKKVQGLRRVVLPSERDAQDRQLTAWRQRLGQSCTRTINRIKRLLRKHNLSQECPTKGIDTVKGKQWLAQVSLGSIDRREMDQLLAQWKLAAEQIAQVELDIGRRQAENATAVLIATIPGTAAYSSLALAAQDRFHRTLPAGGEPGQLLGSYAWLPELGRDHRPAGFDYQARQRPGPLHPGPDHAACSAAGWIRAGLVPADQTASRVENRPGGGDASAGDDHLADDQTPGALPGGRSPAEACKSKAA